MCWVVRLVPNWGMVLPFFYRNHRFLIHRDRSKNSSENRDLSKVLHVSLTTCHAPNIAGWKTYDETPWNIHGKHTYIWNIHDIAGCTVFPMKKILDKITSSYCLTIRNLWSNLAIAAIFDTPPVVIVQHTTAVGTLKLLVFFSLTPWIGRIPMMQWSEFGAVWNPDHKLQKPLEYLTTKVCSLRAFQSFSDTFPIYHPLRTVGVVSCSHVNNLKYACNLHKKTATCTVTEKIKRIEVSASSEMIGGTPRSPATARTAKLRSINQTINRYTLQGTITYPLPSHVWSFSSGGIF